MTIFPQPPRLSEPDEEGFSTLLEPHLTFVPLFLRYSLMVYIEEGYKTDGASVPREELEDSKIAKEICKIIARYYPEKNYKETLDYLIGTPFEMPRLLAAVVHDALYDCKWKFRWLSDQIYRRILSDLKYDPIRKNIEYSGIRLLGWKNWNSVTDLKRDRTKKIVAVKVVRNSRKKKLISELDKA
ncbi:MAG: DUF1353 domain-containing protein [Prevotella sp.]|nr:DUF1353 domain-containing protein [Prevotella sp.]